MEKEPNVSIDSTIEGLSFQGRVTDFERRSNGTYVVITLSSPLTVYGKSFYTLKAGSNCLGISSIYEEINSIGSNRNTAFFELQQTPIIVQGEAQATKHEKDDFILLEPTSLHITPQAISVERTL